MRWKKHSPEEIVAKLSSIQRDIDNGLRLQEAIDAAEVSQATYFRWRAQYGALSVEQLQLIKQLQTENARLRRALAEIEPPSLLSA